MSIFRRSRQIRSSDLEGFAADLLNRQQRSPATVKGYRRDVERYVAYRGKRKDSLEVARSFAALPVRKGAPSSTTIGNRIFALRSIIAYLDIPDFTAKLHAPKRPKRLPKPAKDLHLKVSVLDFDDPLRWTVMFAAETGLRLAELLAVDEDPSNIRNPLPVIGKGNKERFVVLTETAEFALIRLGGHVPFKRRNLQRKMSLLGFTPHQLRHWLGCALAEAGADLGAIQEILGHENPSTTRGYTEISERRMRLAQDLRRSLPLSSEGQGVSGAPLAGTETAEGPVVVAGSVAAPNREATGQPPTRATLPLQANPDERVTALAVVPVAPDVEEER